MTKLRSVLPTIGGAVAVGLFLGACHLLGVAHAQAVPVPVTVESVGIDWTNVLLGINAALLVILTVLAGFRTWLAKRAPLTPSLWDDKARDFLSEAIDVLNVFRGITRDMASRGLPTTTIVNVEQAKPADPDPTKLP